MIQGVGVCLWGCMLIFSLSFVGRVVREFEKLTGAFAAEKQARMNAELQATRRNVETAGTVLATRWPEAAAGILGLTDFYVRLVDQRLEEVEKGKRGDPDVLPCCFYPYRQRSGKVSSDWPNWWVRVQNATEGESHDGS